MRTSAHYIIPISSNSSIKLAVSLDACAPYVMFDVCVDWHENRKMLKGILPTSPYLVLTFVVEFPVNVLSSEATYSTQFGHIKRPTHKNTSWDIAKFEVPGHHFVDLSEHGFGVSVLTNCKYGYACLKNVLSLAYSVASANLVVDNACFSLEKFQDAG